ncbi:PTS sugar transporter subunit IIB [Enterococcus casseliflavus]|uniref:PTS sugar transporter subunit IIB n=1 Tax=Enterococcus casseliflavus TaxID=37734 RepID=UPI00403C0419
MKKIVLLCAAGMSTSMLVNKMREHAKEINQEIEIDAYPISDATEQASDADAILLGPQVRFQEKKIKEMFPDKNVSTIDMRDYGTMNGKKVLETTLKSLGE